MKRLINAIVFLIAANAVYGKCADGLDVMVVPSPVQFTSESVHLKVVFTNTSDRAILFLRPLIGRDMIIRVYDKSGEEMACSRRLIENDSRCYGDVPREHIRLKPLEKWVSDSFELFSVVYPAICINSNQYVRVVVVCSINNKKYEAEVSLNIPPPDLRIRPEYISQADAIKIAENEIMKQIELWNLIRDVKPVVKCINGSYRIVYSRPIPRGVRGSSSLASVKIDAMTGRVLQMSGAGD